MPNPSSKFRNRIGGKIIGKPISNDDETTTINFTENNEA
jgi:hypothetical protein